MDGVLVVTLSLPGHDISITSDDYTHALLPTSHSYYQTTIHGWVSICKSLHSTHRETSYECWYLKARADVSRPTIALVYATTVIASLREGTTTKDKDEVSA
jgi:hypothetical protein